MSPLISLIISVLPVSTANISIGLNWFSDFGNIRT
jgi:hypothetical protein